jgi:CysZ protein
MGLRDGAKAVAAKAVELPTASVVGYWRGLTYPFKGAKLVFFEHPKLVRFWIVPILITLVLLSLSFVGGWASHEAVTDGIWRDPTEQTLAPKLSLSGPLSKEKPRDKRVAPPSSDWTDASAHYLHSTLEVVILLLLWASGLIAVVLLTSVIAAPFNDLLSEEVEHLVTGVPSPPFSWKVIARDTVRTVGLEAVKLVIYAVVMLPLFALAHFVPAVGHVIYSIFAFIFTALYFSVDFVDWPASRRNRSITYRFGMLTEHLMPMFGFGTGVWLFLFVPLVNLLFMPAAVAGGTLLFLDLEGREKAGTGTEDPMIEGSEGSVERSGA